MNKRLPNEPQVCSLFS